AQFSEVARVDAEPFERASSRFSGSGGHYRMNRTHVNVDRVEQQSRTVRVRVQPTFKSYLLKMLWLTRARFDLRVIHEFDISLLPVVGLGADGGNVETMRSFHVGSIVEPTDEGVSSDVDGALDVPITAQRKIRKPT